MSRRLSSTEFAALPPSHPKRLAAVQNAERRAEDERERIDAARWRMLDMLDDDAASGVYLDDCALCGRPLAEGNRCRCEFTFAGEEAWP